MPTTPRDAWLSEDPLPEDPIPILRSWQDEAFADRALKNPHAVALATANAAGRPSVRMVLCNEIREATGALIFYTHRDSRKGSELADREWAAAVFYWAGTDRQARVEGPVSRLPDDESDRYFAGRPLEARVGAWASRQSRPIESREALERHIDAEAQRLGVRMEAVPDGTRDAVTIQRPPHWGGYRLWPALVELWVSRPARIHDRAEWTRDVSARDTGEPSPSSWRVRRLQP